MADDLFVLALAAAAVPGWVGPAILAIAAVTVGTLWWTR